MSVPKGLPTNHFALVFAALLVTSAGNTALQSILPVISRSLDVHDMAVAAIFSLSALMWTFSAPFWARRSDVHGRRRLMQVGLTGFSVSMLICGLVILLGLNGVFTTLVTFILFVVGRAIFGVFGAAGNPAAQAYVAGRTTQAERTAALATLASAFGLGTIVGPALAPLFILPFFELSGPMFAFAIVAVVMIVALQLWLPNDAPGKLKGLGAVASMPSVGAPPTGMSAVAADHSSKTGKRRHMKVSDPRIRPFMIYGFATGSLQAATGQTIGFLLIDRIAPATGADAPQLIAVTFMSGAGATLLAQWGIIRLLKLAPSQLMRWGALIAMAGVAIVSVAETFHLLVLGFAIASAGFGFARPGFTAGSSLAVSRAEQGAVAGASTSISGACFILAPAAGIGLYQLGPHLPYTLSAIGLAALAIFAWANPRLSQSDPKEA